MIESFEYKGKWRLPPQRKWYDGILKYSPNSDGVLELFGSFTNSSFDNVTKPVILGRTNAGEFTLLNSRPNGTSAHYPTKTILANYEPSFILKGKQLSKTELNYRKASFKLFNFFDWLDTRGLTLESDNSADFEIKYRNPRQINFQFRDKCTGVIEFSRTLKGRPFDTKIEVHEACSITFNYPHPTHYNQILIDIVTFQGFITLNIFEQTYPTQIIFWRDKEPIECIFRHTAYSDRHKRRRKGEYLVDFNDIAPHFSLLVSNWFRFHEELSPITERLRAAFKDKLTFSVTKFMEVISAIEVFHRRTQNNERLPKEQFDDFMARVLGPELNADEKKLLTDILQYNEPSLRRRLNELINDYAKEYLESRVNKHKVFVNKKTFINLVLDSRNYYTHFSKSLESKALKHTDLYQCTEILFGLLISCIYQYLGVNPKIIDKALQYKFKF